MKYEINEIDHTYLSVAIVNSKQTGLPLFVAILFKARATVTFGP